MNVQIDNLNKDTLALKKKNEELGKKNEELGKKNEELVKKNEELETKNTRNIGIIEMTDDNQMKITKFKVINEN